MFLFQLLNSRMKGMTIDLGILSKIASQASGFFGAAGSVKDAGSIVAKVAVLIASTALFACSTPQLAQQNQWTNSPSIDRLVDLGAGNSGLSVAAQGSDGAFRAGEKMALLGRNLRNCRVTINGATVPSVSYLKSEELKSLHVAGANVHHLTNEGQASQVNSGILFLLPVGVQAGGHNTLKLITPHGEVDIQIPVAELVSVR
jgi:hypothetical protein